MQDEAPLEDRITAEIARINIARENQDDQRNPVGKNLTIRETQRLFLEFVHYWKKIGDIAGGCYRDKETPKGIGIYHNDEEMIKYGLQASTAHLQAGMYLDASVDLSRLMHDFKDCKQAIKMFVELKGSEVYFDNEPFPTFMQVCDHYVRTQISCSLLSGVIGCDRPIEEYKLRRKGLFFKSGGVIVESFCGVEDHEFRGEFTGGVESTRSSRTGRKYCDGPILYRPISVPGERPA